MLGRQATFAAPIGENTTTCNRPSYSRYLCAPDFVKSLFSMREIFYPMSLKKLGYWGLGAGIIAGVVVLDFHYQILTNATDFQSIGFMSSIYLFEPLMQTVNMVLAPYPKATPIDTSPHEVILDIHDDEHEHLVENNHIDMNIESTESSLPDEESASLIKSMRHLVSEMREVAAIVNSNAKEQETARTSMPVELSLVTIPLEDDHPEEAKQDVSAVVTSKKKANDDIAIMIACHNSEKVIAETIISCLRHVKPEQIFVIDNANSLQPTDNAREVVRGVHHKVNYVWSHYGNKTVAQYVATLISSYRYVLTIDDDVHLPLVLDFCTHRINDKVKAICFPVRAIHPTRESSLLVELQDMEYQFSDLAKLVESNYAGGVSFPHGAVCLWEKETFQKVLRLHDTIFYAEDVKLGLILQRLDFRMELVAGSWFDTEAPTTYFGETPNLYEQRVRSWEMGRQVIFFKFVYQLLFVWRSSIRENCFYKVSQFYDVYSNLADWWRLPLFIVMGSDPNFWSRIAEFYFYSVLPALAWNYIKLPYFADRKDLQVPLRTCFAVPFYKAMSSAMAFGGALRAVMIYLPNFRAKPAIDEIEKIETADKAKLEKELAAEPQDGPLTFKRILYRNRFFQAEAKEEACVNASANVSANAEAVIANLASVSC